MKKIIVTIAVMATIGIIGTQIASAGWGGYGSCWSGNGTTAGTDTATSEARAAFFKDTTDLRTQIAVKRVELGTLLHDSSADPATIDTLRSELGDLATELQQKAKDAGIGFGGNGYMMNPGFGMGPAMMGYDAMGPEMMGWSNGQRTPASR